MTSAEHWHLPGLPEAPDRERDRWHEGRTPAGCAFRTPRLTDQAATAVGEEVRRAALAARRERTLEDVVRTASRAACRLASPSNPIGEEATDLLARELGWTPSTAAETLAAMAEGWTESALWNVIREELRDPRVLDEFRPAVTESSQEALTPLRRRRATGPPLLLQVLAGNVPGVSVTATLRALIVRSGVLCKTPQGEPGLLPLFGRALAEADPLLGSSVAATWWPAEAPAEAWKSWVKRSGKVIVYGGANAVQAVRDRVPAEADVVAYGPKLGIAVVLADASEGDTEEVATAAVGLARDMCAYDQQGCVSPRLAYVVGDARGFADRLAGALETEVERLGRPAPLPEEALQIRMLRAEAEWGSNAGVLGSQEDLAWTIIVEQTPGLRSEGLPRVLRLYPLDRVESLSSVLAPLEGRIQSMGYAGREGLDILADQAAELGSGLAAGRLAARRPPPAASPALLDGLGACRPRSAR
jgi:hypothetical protein